MIFWEQLLITMDFCLSVIGDYHSCFDDSKPKVKIVFSSVVHV